MTQINKCNSCNGSGKISCPLCGGQGKVVKKGNLWSELGVGDRVECHGCQGTGKLLCKICGGAGKIRIENKSSGWF